MSDQTNVQPEDAVAPNGTSGETAPGITPKALPERVAASLSHVAEEMGGAYAPNPAAAGAVGHTTFDNPASEDNNVTVLLTKEDILKLPSQAMVRIKTYDETGERVDREYLGIVVRGPFAKPDGIRPDAHIVEISAARGHRLIQHFHGWAEVQMLGELIKDKLIPPRFRPLPYSSVHPLTPEETAAALRLAGEIRLGTLVGQEEIEVRLSTKRKDVLPRHLGIIGTTGAGKSTTVSGFVNSLQEAGAAVIIFDIEPEYTDIDRPTEDAGMLTALEERGLKPRGTKSLTVYVPVGRKTGREGSPVAVKEFCLPFAELSPYTVMDILDLNDAQRERYYAAFEATKHGMRELGIYPGKGNKAEQTEALELDEFDRGYPRMTLSHLIDVVNMVVDQLQHSELRDPYTQDFKSDAAKGMIKRRIEAMKPTAVTSWLAVLGRLWTVHRLGIFDSAKPGVQFLNYKDLIRPGRVSVIDLGDTDSPLVNNLLIASILRGVQRAQEDAVDQAKAKGEQPTLVNVVIEEAHEFLSKERISRMESLFQQVARIAKRGRKRWLGLTFVTQLPQHLPDEVLGLLNSFVLHKIGDSNVIDRLRRSISGPDKAQWGLLPGLAPGQALVSFAGMTRPLLVTIDPTPSYLRLID